MLQAVVEYELYIPDEAGKWGGKGFERKEYREIEGAHQSKSKRVHLLNYSTSDISLEI